MAVKTLVEPGRGYQTMLTGDYELPIIHQPITLPAPAPGEYRQMVKRDLWGDIAYWWKLARVGSEGRRMAWNQIKGDLKFRWFRFKLVHGITVDDRSWLFKR